MHRGACVRADVCVCCVRAYSGLGHWVRTNLPRMEELGPPRPSSVPNATPGDLDLSSNPDLTRSLL
jgi:hypothetical protein